LPIDATAGEAGGPARWGDLGGAPEIVVDGLRGNVHVARTARALEQREQTHAVRRDEQRVQQIGRVLVDNAVRHNPEGTEVRVEVGADDGHVTLTVSDNGPGIDDESQRHLFERFWRGPQGSSSGSGLGLAIAGEMAQRMGGEIAVHSDAGHTSFALRLPSESLSAEGGDR